MNNTVFTRRAAGGYFVERNGEIVGAVERITKAWVAYGPAAKAGDDPVAEAATRKAAAEALT